MAVYLPLLARVEAMTWQDIATPFIQQFEGCELTAYHGAADRPGLWTIGYGATGPDIVEGTVWTQEQADDRFAATLQGFGAGVDSVVKVPLTDHQKAACVSFCYNLGMGSFERSTLLILLNQSNYSGASMQFPNWCKANGVQVAGLDTTP